MSEEGEIKLYVGSMYAGKSEMVIRELKKLKPHPGNIRCVMSKPQRDTRYKDEFVRTHDGVSYPAIITPKLADIEADLIANYDVIGIDEGQFFDDLAEVVIRLADEHHKKIFIAALD